MKLFTTGEVAKILNLPGTRIRSFVRSGFLSPSRGTKKQLQFSFQDLLLLKTTKELLDSQVPAKKLARLLASLKRQLPQIQHLSRIKIFADGRRVVVWDGKARWQPDSGQFLFNFDVQSVAKRISLGNLSPAKRQPSLDAAHWFKLGLELEATSVKEAQRAYHQALELNPKMVEAHLNLGKLYHENNDLTKACAHYEAAIQHAPDDPCAHFNRGVLLEDMKQPQEAVRAYRRAIDLDPDFADAHYNLGLLCDSLGKKTDAIAHLNAARKLYRRT